MLYNRRAARPLRFALIAAGIYVLHWVSGFPRIYDDDELPPGRRHNAAASAVGADQLIVSVKTTTPNVWTELPPLLLFTDPADYETLLLMGDLPLTLSDFRIEDLLDRFSQSFIAENEELDRYRDTLDFAVNRKDFAKLKESDWHEERRVLAKLDKYKILRWIERTWLLRPDREWYLFIEPDVYVARPNLLTWLGGFNSREHHFFANLPSADSGFSFILSAGAMRTMIVDRPDIVSNYERNIQSHKNAFDVLSKVLSTTLDLSRTAIWPGISDFNPTTVPYGPGFWCEHILALSNMSVEQLGNMQALDRQKRDGPSNEPLSFSDLWIRFVQSENLGEPRAYWDNLSSGRGYGQWNILFEDSWSAKEESGNVANKAISGEESWEACRVACDRHELCMQWSYSSLRTSNDNANSDTKCHLSRSLKLGRHVDVREIDLDDDEKADLQWKSGWQIERFQNWMRQQRCKGQHN